MEIKDACGSAQYVQREIVSYKLHFSPYCALLYNETPFQLTIKAC